MRLLLPLALVACGPGPAVDIDQPTSHDSGTTGPPTDTATDPVGACGDVTVHQITLVGAVTSASGAPAAGAHVWVEDRGWEPGTILADGSADTNGDLTLDLAEVTSVEDCWATLLDYVLVGEQAGEHGERDLNIDLFNAIEDGSFVADLGAFPLRLESTL